MAIRKAKNILIFLTVILTLVTSCAFAGTAGIYESLIFEQASIILSNSMAAYFDAGANANCASIYVSSCTLEKQSANGKWTEVGPLAPPSKVATNTSDFGAEKDYSSSCTSGNTYRIRAVFAAVYKGTTYTVSRTSRAVAY